MCVDNRTLLTKLFGMTICFLSSCSNADGNSDSSCSGKVACADSGTREGSHDGNSSVLSDAGLLDVNLPNGISVSGLLLDTFGRPFPAQSVRIRDKITTTSIDGKFQFSEVVAPYDVTVVTTQTVFGYRPTAHIFKQLMSSRPILQTFRSAPPIQDRRANVEIMLTGSTFPGTATTEYVASLTAHSNDAVGSATVGPEGDLRLRAGWHEELTTQSKFLALQWEVDAAKQFKRYLAWAETSIALADAATVKASVATRAVPAGFVTIAGTVTAPAQTKALASELILSTSSGDANLKLAETEGERFSFRIPTGITGISPFVHVSVSAESEFQNAWTRMHVPVTGSSESIVIDAVPTLLSPQLVSGALNLKGEFKWQAPAETISYLSVGCERGQIVVVTDGTSAVLPDVSELGVDFPVGRECWIELRVFGPYRSLDAAATEANILLPEFTWLGRGYWTKHRVVARASTKQFSSQ